ncbi:MAG: aminoacyl-tRNA hydrolase [Bdellovibrionales bacterium]|nr:aminoacyl-tRNA hydrolase [Bdellovibrionales bacterium]
MKVPRNEIYFTFARSSGPGGQNVNKVNSKAVLHWNVRHSALPRAVILRFLAKFSNRVREDGECLLQSDRYRDQPRNKEDCILRLNEMLDSVKTPPRRRRKTRPTKASKEKRLTTKRKQGEKKRLRGFRPE